MGPPPAAPEKLDKRTMTSKVKDRSESSIEQKAKDRTLAAATATRLVATFLPAEAGRIEDKAAMESSCLRKDDRGGRSEATIEYIETCN